MEDIRILVQTLIVIAVLVIFLEMFLPRNTFKNYLNMLVGLLIIVAILQTFSSLSGGKILSELPALALGAGEGENQNYSLEEIINEGNSLGEVNEEVAIEQYKKGLLKQIRALVEMQNNFRVVEVEVEFNNEGQSGALELEKIILVLSRGVDVVSRVDVLEVEIDNSLDELEYDNSSKEAEKIAVNLSNFYNLEREQIKISWL